MVNSNVNRNVDPIKLKEKLGIGFVIASLFFLFNPDINVVDVIPDVFGYILMSVGLSQLSLLNDHIFEARARFNKMIFVSAAKLASIIFIFGMSDAASRPYSYLLFSFSFLVIDLLFLVPAYNELFKGLMSLSDKYDGKTAYLAKSPTGKSYAERIGMLSVAFCILKSVSATWPEFISLVSTEYTDSFVMYMYEYIGAFRIIACIPATVIGVTWLVKTLKFFIRLENESEFIDKMKRAMVSDIFPKKGFFIRRTLNTVLTMLIVAAVFSIDFSLGSVGVVGDSAAEINILPDAITALLVVISMGMLRKYVEDCERTRISAAVFLAVSVIASALKIYFIVKFDYYTAINKVDEAYYLFGGMCIVTFLENVAFVIMVVMLSFTLREVIKKYTGYVAYANSGNSERVHSLQHELLAKLKYPIIFAVIGAVTATVYEVLLPEKFLLAQYMWLIDFVAQGIFAAAALKCFFAIKDEVDNRFMLE